MARVRNTRKLRKKLILSRETVRKLVVGFCGVAKTGDCSCVGCSHHCAGFKYNQVAQ